MSRTLDERPVEAPTATGDPATARPLPGERAGGVVALLALLLALVGATVAGNEGWLARFARDFAGWIAHPNVAGGFHPPVRWVAGLAVAAAAVVLGLELAWIVLRRTVLAHSRAAVMGVGLVLGPCALGYLATVAEVVGWLSQWVLVGALAVALALATVVVARDRALMAERLWRRASSSERSPWDVALVLLAAIVVALVVVHVAMSPIIEWDAVVYHAGVAKLWFAGRPSPPLLYGPSVGLEISANYPPLFPATGAFFDVVLNRFDDFYLRVLPPLVMAGTLAFVWSYVRARFGPSSARWATLLFLGCPLLVLYGSWPTGYIYLLALATVAVALLDLSLRQMGAGAWKQAGGIVGLACTTSFFGLVLVPVGLIAALAARLSWREAARRAFAFLYVAVAVVEPWYVRNLALLHNPLYPLGAPPLPGKGLVGPLWRASEREIENNALGVWTSAPGSHVGFGLRLRELWHALAGQELLAVGLLFAVVGGVWVARRRAPCGFLVGALVVLVVVPMTPGWYWVRDLAYAMPLGAVVGGVALVHLTGGLRSPLGAPRAVWRAVAVPTKALVAALCVAVALALAVVGPDAPTWPMSLPAYDNFMTADRDLGSVARTLDYVFAGDYRSWTWLNAHLGAHGRVATLEDRVYYLQSAPRTFYLDGLEAAPLLGVHDPATAAAFLEANGVRYVFVPSWASSATPTRHPVLDDMALFDMLGTPDFPLVALFANEGYDVPDAIYRVGAPAGPSPTIRPVLVTGRLRADGAFAQTSALAATIPADNTSPRLYVPVRGRDAVLSFRFRLPARGRLEVNEYDYVGSTWIDGLYAAQGTGRWMQVSLPLVASGRERFVMLGLYSSGTGTDIADVRVTQTDPPSGASQG
ncbi:MAG TPA: hypothetical protein VE991_02830 [Acidimicrobiales bacterium]|nr:hypothetical protein [Acidimicrobiales bacterium]